MLILCIGVEEADETMFGWSYSLSQKPYLLKLRQPYYTKPQKFCLLCQKPERTPLNKYTFAHNLAFASSLLHSLKMLPEYTRSQLALRNGQDRDEIWVAYQGEIYDVTKSRLWRRGQHYEHWAGQDLTDELKDAPHTEYVFDKFSVVGLLKK